MKAKKKQYSLSLDEKTFEALKKKARKLSHDRNQDISWQNFVRQLITKALK